MIVVTGAMGQLGRLIIANLLEKIPTSEIVATARNIEKAGDLSKFGIEVRKADYDKIEDWPSALKGADKLLLISSSEIGQRVRQHSIVINAAKEAGVKLLVYTSILHADTSKLDLASEHRETEAMIRASGVPFVFLRNGWYIENYTAGIGTALSLGAVYGCAENGKISAATRADFAEAAAVIMGKKDQGGKIYELAGDQSFTLSDLAAGISKETRKDIPYVNLDAAAYTQALLKAGLPQPFAEILANSEKGISQGELFDDSRQLSKIIGRPTTTLSTVIRNALASV